MSAHRINEDDFQRREQDLKEREMKVRLRELEAELEAQRKIVNNPEGESESATVQKELDPDALAWQRKLRKMLFFSKFALLAIGVAATVVLVKVMLFPIVIFGALGLILYGIYYFLIQEKSEQKTPKP